MTRFEAEEAEASRCVFGGGSTQARKKFSWVSLSLFFTVAARPERSVGCASSLRRPAVEAAMGGGLVL